MATKDILRVWSISHVYVQMQMYDEAVTEYQKVIKLSPGVSVIETAMKAIIGHLHARRGDRIKASGILDEVAMAIAEGINVSAYIIAAIHSALGERELAFEWLNKAYEQREVHLVSLKVDPFLDGIRADERFDAMIRRVGLPEQ